LQRVCSERVCQCLSACNGFWGCPDNLK
jgi:hypothetical protein